MMNRRGRNDASGAARSGPGAPRLKAAVACLAAVGAVALAERPARGQAGRNEDVLRYGIVTSMMEDVNPNDALAATLVLVREIIAGSQIFKEARAALYSDAASAVSAVNAGEVDVVAISTLDYLSVAPRLRADPALVYARRDGGDTGLALVARSDVGDVRALVGKRISVCSPTLQVPDLAQVWLRVLTLEAGLPEQAVHEQVVRKASQAVLAVFFRQADAAIVPASAFDTQVEQNPQIGRELHVVTRSPSLLTGVMCLRRSLDQRARDWIVKQATSIHGRPFTRETFVVLKVSRIVPFEARMVEPIRQLLDRYNTLRKSAGGR